MRTVMCTLNGQLRPDQVRDRSSPSDVDAAEKADPSKPGHVAAPFAGVVTLAVAEGDAVEAGATVATIEAMKMEASITAPVGRHRRAARDRRHPAGRGRRPGARHRLTTRRGSTRVSGGRRATGEPGRAQAEAARGRCRRRR